MKIITRNQSLLGAAALLAALSSCTAVKPVACAVVHPIRLIQADLDADREDRPDDLPAAFIFAEAPILIPLKYVYYTAYSAIGGLFSGLASDLITVTGGASVKQTKSNLTRPMRTNARLTD